MVRKDTIKTQPFTEEFEEETSEMVKLAPRKRQKMSRKERIEKRKEKNEQIKKILELSEQPD
jgi:glutamate synthase domain-containing protein 3